MDILQTSRSQRLFGLLLLPFKLYVVAASVWLIYWALEARSKDIIYGGPLDYLVVAYAICIPFFFVAALVQFIAHWRHQALISVSFAFAASIILVIWLQCIPTSFT